MEQTLLCVDNSIVIKWVTDKNERNWEKARHFLGCWQRANIKLVAPPVFDGELRKALHRKVEEGWITEEQWLWGLHVVRSLVETRSHPDLEYVALAFERYLKSKDTYDTMYMALAALHDCDLWTHDGKWVDRENGIKLSSVFPFIKVLQDQPEPLEFVLPSIESYRTDQAITKQLEADIFVTLRLSPHHPSKLKNTLIVIPGVSGDGSNGTLDYIDRQHTTACINPESHTFG